MLVTMAREGSINLLYNRHVQKETNRWLDREGRRFPWFMEELLLLQPNPPQTVIDWVEPNLANDIDDIGVVAGAVGSNAAYLATFDRKHILSLQRFLYDEKGLIVDTPGEILKKLRQSAGAAGAD